MIRFFFRWFFRLAVLAVVLAAALILLKDTLMREWIHYRLRSVTGLETRLGPVQSGFLAGSLTVSDLHLYNPPEFGGGILLSIPDLHLQWDTSAARRGDLRFQLVRLHLAELSLVRNAQGQTNIYQILDDARHRVGLLDAALLHPPGFEFTGIDTLNLTLGTLRLVNLGPPVLQYDRRLGLTNEILRNVRSQADLSPLIFRFLLQELLPRSP